MATPTLTFPAHFVRWLLAPAAIVTAIGAVFASFASLLRRCARDPSLPRMSPEWMHSHDRDSGKYIEHWR